MIVKNFLFHRVSDETDLLWPPMPAALFQSLIAFISSRYQVVSLENDISTGYFKKNGKAPATILFDDGYKDNIEFAVPILKQYKCPASFYVVTDCINENIPTWTYAVDYLLQHTRIQELILDMDFVPSSLRVIECKNELQRIKAGGIIKPWMKGLSNEKRQLVFNHLRNIFTDVDLPRDKMMSWKDLQQMESAGFYIGSHSLTHPLLASIKEEDELLLELRESAKQIQINVGKFPVTISYPVGSYNDSVISCAKQAGYKMGLAVEQRFYDTEKDDIFAIPRVELYNEPMWKCKLRISGIYNWLKRRIQ
ncbi:MAG: polysaccharide deacetylase family protein [Chitinophagaceae bacterium]